MTGATGLLRQATSRLLLAVLVSVLATIAAGVWGLRSAADAAVARQLSDAGDYLSRRAAQFERRWEAEAFALKTQIELARLTDELQHASSRLTSFFTAQGGVGQFSALVIRDRQGALLYRHPATLDADALPVGRSGWFADGPSATLYRVLHQPLWMGSAGMGSILLLRPLDNALLYETAYPGTQLSLEWQGKVLASSLGSRGIGAAPPLPGRAGSGGEFKRLEWVQGAPGPTLHVERVGGLPFDIGWVLVAGPVASVVVGVFAWLLLSRWLRSTAQRLGRVEAAVTRFGADTGTEGASDTALAAESGPDEIGRLAQGIRVMLRGVVDARAEQARMQASLQELNAELERRVEQRTRELAASRDAALEGARAKEMFVANMSHELRTPMNGLLGALELLGQTRMDARQRSLLDTAATSGEALLSIINDVLDFSKINAGKLELVREAVQLRELVAAAMTLFSASAGSKGIALRLEWDDRLPQWVEVDAVRLRQILLNLLGNAVKFTASGSVVLRGRRGDPDVDTLVLEVDDTGIGIPADQLDSIFDPFVQADSSHRRQHGGTGLGLAISRRLAEAMGGRISVRSRPGAGSRFRLRIPILLASGAEAPVADQAPVEPVTHLSGRVLLVEDNVVNRVVASAMLAHLGLEVVECGDGREACELTRGEAFDLVLMDVMMPVLDGLAATREIRAREAREGLDRLPIIALTASALRPDVEAAFEAGMDDHVPKPFTMQQIAQALARRLPVMP
ncbi:MAG: response regulator [Burkholderiales bacterium]|nr:response regulator [Burkholderiales bacterium]